MPLLDTSKAARYLNVSAQTMRDWRKANSGPSYSQMRPRKFLYDTIALDQYVADRLVRIQKDGYK